MIAITAKSKKALKEMVGQNIDHLVVETSLFGKEYTGDNSGIPFVGPGAYQRKFYGQLWSENGILAKVK